MSNTNRLSGQLPKIQTNNRQMREVSADAMNALVRANSPPEIFVRSGRLVQFRVDENYRPMLELVDEKILRSRLARVADFCAVSGKNDGMTPVDPPISIVRDILALGEWDFPPIVSIVECPVLRPSGTILSSSGYDPETKLYYYPSHELTNLDIPENPTEEQVQDSLELLQEVIIDFPFSDRASRTNTLGLILTPVIRPAISGNVPMALIDAPQAGTGKGLLGEITSHISTGHNPLMMPCSKSSEEWRKKITSALLADASIIVVDNVTSELNSEILASALTSPEWGDRLLGKNEIVRLPQRATIMANGNNIRLGGDLPRRCYQIRLDAEMSRPWQRSEFKHPKLIEWIDENRGRLISAALILARAWFTAGKPVYRGPTIGGFTEWTNVVGGILQNAGINGFLENIEGMYDTADEESLQWESFLLTLYELHADTWLTTADICESLKMYSGLSDLLPDEFKSPFDYDGQVLHEFKLQLGREFKKRVNTRFGSSQVYIERGDEKHRGVAKWLVVCGDAGVCGVPQTPSQITFTDYSMIEGVEIIPAIPATPADLKKECWACGSIAWLERPPERGAGHYCSHCHPS